MIILLIGIVVGAMVFLPFIVGILTIPKNTDNIIKKIFKYTGSILGTQLVIIIIGTALAIPLIHLKQNIDCNPIFILLLFDSIIIMLLTWSAKYMHKRIIATKIEKKSIVFIVIQSIIQSFILTLIVLTIAERWLM